MSVFAIYNMKGGVGKTTTAVNLAHVCAATGLPTLLWDLDPQGAATHTLRVRPHVAGLDTRSLPQPATLTAAIKATDFDHLELLPADFAYRKIDRLLDRHAAALELAATLTTVCRGHTHAFLDCPPGFSLLTEAVFAAADVVLVPTQPSVLSLRTLARVLERGGRRSPPPRLLAFLSMLEPGHSLQGRIDEWTRTHPELFVGPGIPRSATVERVTSERLPLAILAPDDPAAAAYRSLWRALRTCTEDAPPDLAPALATLHALVDELSADPTVVAAPTNGLQSPPPPAAAAHAGTGREIEYKLAVGGEADFDALARVLPSAGSGPTVLQIKHFFDTAAGDLRRRGFVLRLGEERGRFVVTAKGPTAGAGGALADRPEEETRIDAAWAAKILAGDLSPLGVLEQRNGDRAPRLLAELRAIVGRQPLQRIGTYENRRQRLGPIAWPVGEQTVAMTLELDRTAFPGGEVDHEVEVEVDDADAAAAGQALRDLFARAGVPWRAGSSKAQRLFARLPSTATGQDRAPR